MRNRREEDQHQIAAGLRERERLATGIGSPPGSAKAVQRMGNTGLWSGERP